MLTAKSWAGLPTIAIGGLNDTDEVMIVVGNAPKKTLVSSLSAKIVGAVNQLLTGAIETKGASEALSNYITARSTTGVYGNNTPFTVAGFLDSVSYWVTTLAGTNAIKIFNSSNVLIHNITVQPTATGLNTFVAGTHFETNVQINPGDFLTLYKPSTGSTFGSKVKTSSVLFTTDTALTGAPATFSTITTYELGVTANVKSANLTKSITDNTNSVTDLQNRYGKTVLYSDMSALGNWVAEAGAPGISVSAGEMHVVFTTGVSQSVAYRNILRFGVTYKVRLRVKLLSGTVNSLRIGFFTSTNGLVDSFDIVPTSTYKEFIGYIKPNFNLSVTNLSIGALAGANLGGEVVVDYVELSIDGTNSASASSAIPAPVMFNISEVFSSLSKNDKKLTKVAILGDSLVANQIGGAITGDEGQYKRPIRLCVNNIARRAYDLLSWNKATHRNLADAAWTKSGTWTDNAAGVFEPVYTSTYLDPYYKSIVANSYAEIAIPSGQTEFALVLQKGSGYGTLAVTLNGGSIASYGPSSINLQRANAGSEHTGNPYYIVQYTGLPAGINTIRVTKSNDVLPVGVWGGFWWTGNTMVVHNLGHGGHTFQQLITEHLTSEFKENNYDAVIFSLTEFNEMGAVGNSATSNAAMINILDNFTSNMDVLYIGVHPYGTDPSDGTPNYYTLYPGLKELNLVLKQTLYNRGLPFVDLFTIFERKTINRGGTLVNGDAGTYYTSDGQHQSTFGEDERWANVKKALLNNPLIIT